MSADLFVVDIQLEIKGFEIYQQRYKNLGNLFPSTYSDVYLWQAKRHVNDLVILVKMISMIY